jgi:hypothetical protein
LEERRKIISEQDRAYEESLQIDRQKVTDSPKRTPEEVRGFLYDTVCYCAIPYSCVNGYGKVGLALSPLMIVWYVYYHAFIYVHCIINFLPMQMTTVPVDKPAIPVSTIISEGMYSEV